MSTGFKLTLMRCPHGAEAISLDTEEGGTRLTGSKCCGRWTNIREWPMSLRDLRGAAEEFHNAHNEALEANNG